MTYRGSQVDISFFTDAESLVRAGPQFAQCELRCCDPVDVAQEAINHYLDMYGDRKPWINREKNQVLRPLFNEPPPTTTETE